MRFDIQRAFSFALVSHPQCSRLMGALFAAALLIPVASITSKGAELSVDTLKFWDDYVQTQNARVAEYSNATPFLWSDRSPERLRRLHKGETVVVPVGENPRRVPQGLIHHWVGAVFLPGASLDNVLTVVRDYAKYKDYYAPNVVESELLHQTHTEDKFALRMLNSAALSKFALDTEFQDTFKRIDEHKWYCVSYTTRVREVENYGLRDEYEAPANAGRGLIWRLYSISRFEQRDGGVYVELEAVALTRDVPGALRWLVDPIVRRISKSSMQVSLQKTAGAVRESGSVARNNDNIRSIPVKSPVSDFLPAARVQTGSSP